MADNFKILDGDELFGQGKTDAPKPDNTMLWLGLGTLGVLFIGVCIWAAYEAGRENVMPAITDVKKENDDLKQKISECPYFQVQNKNSCAEKNQSRNV